jgi:peptidoglycan glycosyltransferase
MRLKKKRAGQAERGDEKPQKKNQGNREIVILTYFMTMLLLALAVYFGWYLIVKSDTVINSTYNKRSDLMEQKVTRGTIYSSDGEVLAETVEDDFGNTTREYPFGSLFVHVVGRYTHGKTGLELSENFNMLRSNINPLVKIANELQGEKNPGDNIITTLDTKLQKAASDALGNYRGAVVVLEPDTGKILAMVSKPDYSPDLDQEEWNQLSDDTAGESRLLNRATQGLYAPGSTFKILTALEYMRENKDYAEYQYDCRGNDVFGEVKIKCYGGSVHGLINLKTSFLKSCNTSFANIGMTLDKGKFRSLCDSFLFNTDLSVPFSCKQSSFVIDQNSADEEMPQTAIGQGKTVITPLHNAMIAAAVANGGILMKPYLVDRRENAYGESVSKTVPSEYGTLMTQEEAQQLTEYMKAVVEEGTGSVLKGASYQAAGKTGSAEYDSSGNSHAWFVGFAPADNPKIAISVIVEEAGSGGSYAAPVAKAVFDAYFG